jgi:hypothetical protein
MSLTGSQPNVVSPTQTQQHFAPPSGAPPGRSDMLSAPPLPQRRDSEAQPDDIEDVKKVCQKDFTSKAS